MFFRDIIPYTKLDTFKEELLKQRNFINVSIFAWIIGMLLMCIIFMSLMIVKVSSTSEFYQNQTAALRTRNIQSYSDHNSDTTLPTVVQIDGQEQQQPQQQQMQLMTTTTNFVQPPTHPLRTPIHNKSARMDEMRAEAQQQLLQQQQLQQQQYQQQQATQHQHEMQHYQQHHRQTTPPLPPLPSLPQQQEQKSHVHATGETAYLLERADSNNAAPLYEQPIYGTWRMKARRPQPQPPSIAAVHFAGNAKPPTDADQYQSTELQQRRQQQQQQQQHRQQPQPQLQLEPQPHVYEQLPRRVSTMTPVRSELHDQIPRPPRLTSRQPSMVLRRQYLEIPINASFTDDEKPKPFHFPQDGPVPQEFRKAEEQRGGDVNNIQDILQQLHLGGGASKVPSLVMMPTGLHIAGSFKNLKSSGITNFFRGKRNKKQLQLSIPLPMPMQLLKPYPPGAFNVMPQPYQQRFSMDHIYPFKPRSPNDINLLAMQQQQQLKSNRSKHHKKYKQNNANLLLQQYSNQRPYAADPYMAAHYQNYQQQFLDANAATQKAKTKRLPFKVNLDIFPVLPPTKDYKSAAYPYDELRSPTTTRAAAINHPRNPFLDYYSFPFVSTTPVYPSYGAPYEQHGFAPFRFPTSPQSQLPAPQSSNTQIMFPDQLVKPQYLLPAGNQQTPFMPLDITRGSASMTSTAAAAAQRNKSNQIMVHLNVFPKKKTQPQLLLPPSNNPFYNGAQGINRHIVEEDVASVTGIEPRQQPHNTSVTNSPEQPVSRSDSSDPEAYIDFEHPIVAADVGIDDQPRAAALVSNKLDASDHITSHYDHIETRNNNNFRYNDTTNVDQLASEAQTASLFRFPVEDLIKFQVDDAL